MPENATTAASGAPRPGAEGPRATGLDHEAAVQDVASRLRWAVSRLHRRFRQLSPADITPTRLAALASTDRAGSISIGDLARAEGVAAPTMTRIVDSLEREGLVTRLADAADRRVARIQVTEKGSHLLRAVRSSVDRYLGEGLGGLTPAQLDRLAWAIGVIESLAEAQPDGGNESRRIGGRS